MPTYDYKCKECGHQFEAFQSMSAEPLTECEKCDGTVERVISGGAGLIFKGSGFYITDYRDSSYSKAAEKDSGKTDKKPDTKSDSKPSGDSKAPKAKPSGDTKASTRAA